METKVINIKHQKSGYIYIGRPSIFGNPYTMPKHSREEAVGKFAHYFKRRIAEDQDFAAAVVKLKGKTLGCYCAPDHCHGHVIAAYLDQLTN